MRTRCARTSRSSSRSSTESRSRTSTPPRAPRSRGRCSTRWRRSTRPRTRMSTVASTSSRSARPKGLEAAREKVRVLLNAPAAREVIFVRNATEGINLVAYAWGLSNLGPGDVVLVTELEHHSNFVPWQYVAKRTGAEFRMIPLTDEGDLVLEGPRRARRRRAAEGRRAQPRVERARHGQRRRAHRRVGARARRDRRRRRGTGGAPPSRGRPGRRLRLRRHLGPQDVRAERHRRRLGTGGAARAHGAVHAGRPHDPESAGRRDDLGRPAAQVRGGHRAHGRGGRPRRRDRLPRRPWASRRSSSTSTI